MNIWSIQDYNGAVDSAPTCSISPRVDRARRVGRNGAFGGSRAALVRLNLVI